MAHIPGATLVKEIIKGWITTNEVPSTDSVPGNVPIGGIIAWGKLISEIPVNWALCDGLNGTPDLKHHFILGGDVDSGGVVKSNILGVLLQSGGVFTHHHANHVVTQSAAHIVGQPADHAAVAHAGATIDAHAGAAITDHAALTHSVTQPNNHSDHNSQGGHTHDAHTSSLGVAIAGAVGFFITPTTHNNEGGHTHDAHTAHAGTAVGAHGVIAHTVQQANNHSLGQASAHPVVAHSGATVDAHSGAGVDAHDTLQAVQPFFALAFIMRVL